MQSYQLACIFFNALGPDQQTQQLSFCQSRATNYLTTTCLDSDHQTTKPKSIQANTLASNWSSFTLLVGCLKSIMLRNSVVKNL